MATQKRQGLIWELVRLRNACNAHNNTLAYIFADCVFVDSLKPLGAFLQDVEGARIVPVHTAGHDLTGERLTTGVVINNRPVIGNLYRIEVKREG